MGGIAIKGAGVGVGTLPGRQGVGHGLHVCGCVLTYADKRLTIIIIIEGLLYYNLISLFLAFLAC